RGINGSGMHTNVSVFKDGKNACFDEKDPLQLSREAYWFIGGIIQHIRAITAVTNPLANPFKPLVPRYAAPVYIAWSARNRRPLSRIPAARGEATRIELRSPDPSCNPYLAFALILAAGLDGIQNRIEPPAPTDKNIFRMTPEERAKEGIAALPGSLQEAIEEMEKSVLVRETLGDHIFNKYLEAKRKEWDDYRLEITPWELGRYLSKY